MTNVLKNIAKISIFTAVFASSFSVFAPKAFAWNLQGSCSANVSSANTGDTVTWTATQTSTMTPSQGHYEYVWSGTDSLSGTTQSVSKIYNTTGTKNASVVIKLVLNSGGIETITRTCSVNITTPPPPPPPVGECKLEIVKTVDKATAVPGDILTYTLDFKSVGTAACTGGGVRVEDKFDSNLTYQSETHSANVDPGYNGIVLFNSTMRTLTWDANILQSGQGGTISWTAKVNTPSSCGTFEIPNQAKITSKEYSPNDLHSTPSVWVLSNTVKTAVTKECPPPTLIGSCSVLPSAILTGENTTWSATATGGTGTYTYSWSGTDGLTGTTATLSKLYNSIGTKTGTVTITSGTQTVTKNCTLTVTETPPPPPPSLTGSCSASSSSVNTGENVIWSASATGGTSVYTYVWTGDDGLSSTNSSITKTYSTIGTKNASVTITSGSQSISKNCSISITTPPPPPSNPTPLTASCSASPGVAEIGQNVSWTSSVSGGNGTYVYEWNGTDSLSSTDANITKNYGSAGTKNGTVAVTSGTETVTSALCSVVVRPSVGCSGNCGGGGGIDQPTVVLLKKLSTSSPLAFVYLSQIPYTGLSDHYGLVIFFLALIVWSILVTLVIRKDKAISMAKKLIGMFATVKNNRREAVNFEHDHQLDVTDEDLVDLSAYNNEVPENLPISNAREEEIDSDDTKEIFSRRAKENKVLISDDALNMLFVMTGNVEENLNKTLKIAEEKIEKEDGWILINKARMASIASLISESNEIYNVVAPVPATAVAPVVPEHIAVPASNTSTYGQSNQIAKPADSKEFLLWIARNESTKILNFVRKMGGVGVDPNVFIKSVIYDLDKSYRSRLERDVLVSPELAQVTAGWTSAQIEEMISILFTIIEQSYKNSTLGVKLAIMRIIDLKQFRG